MADPFNGRIGLREYMEALQAANDRANATRFDAILEKLTAIEGAHTIDHKDHEDRLRHLENRESAGTARWSAHEKEHGRQTRTQLSINTAIAGVLASISAWWGATR